MTMTVAEQNYVNEIAEITKNYEEKIVILDKFSEVTKQAQIAYTNGKISNETLIEIVEAFKNAPIENELSRIAAGLLIKKVEKVIQ